VTSPALLDDLTCVVVGWPVSPNDHLWTDIVKGVGATRPLALDDPQCGAGGSRVCVDRKEDAMAWPQVVALAA
jgi:hypothetical protein